MNTSQKKSLMWFYIMKTGTGKPSLVMNQIGEISK